MCIFQSSLKLYPVPKHVKKHILVLGPIALKYLLIMPEQKDVGGLVFLALDPQPPTIKNEGINIYYFTTNILL